MKKLMTYGFYTLLLAVFAVNMDVVTLDDSSSSLSFEMIDNLISQNEVVASNAGCGPNDKIAYTYILNGKLYTGCASTGCTCILV